jgi:uncharacterized protein (TIGR00297 family)
MARFVTALVVTVLFAVAGWASGGVTLSGAAAGLAVAFALYYCAGANGFVVLVVVFALTWVATRIGYARKQQLGIAERRRGRRNAGQVLANIGVSGACAVLACLWKSDAAIVAGMASLAEAAADTVSSECGEAWSDTAYLVTGFRVVPAGTDGAITFAGTLAGMVAAAIVAAAAAIANVLFARSAVLACAAGCAGMLIDSVLGATAERRGLLNNNAVNFTSTAAAAILAAAVHSVLS